MPGVKDSKGFDKFPTVEEERVLYALPYRSTEHWEILDNVMGGGKYWTTNALIQAMKTPKLESELSPNELRRKLPVKQPGKPLGDMMLNIKTRLAVKQVIGNAVRSGRVVRAHSGKPRGGAFGRQFPGPQSVYRLAKRYRAQYAALNSQPVQKAVWNRWSRMRHLSKEDRRLWIG